MNANPILLQIKYARIVNLLAQKMGIPLEKALDLFYGSVTYDLISHGISDMHCLSDDYLVTDIINEYKTKEKQ